MSLMFKKGSYFCQNVRSLGKRVNLNTEEVSVFRKRVDSFPVLTQFELSGVISTQ